MNCVLRAFAVAIFCIGVCMGPSRAETPKPEYYGSFWVTKEGLREIERWVEGSSTLTSDLRFRMKDMPSPVLIDDVRGLVVYGNAVDPNSYVAWYAYKGDETWLTPWPGFPTTTFRVRPMGDQMWELVPSKPLPRWWYLILVTKTTWGGKGVPFIVGGPLIDSQATEPDAAVEEVLREWEKGDRRFAELLAEVFDMDTSPLFDEEEAKRFGARGEDWRVTDLSRIRALSWKDLRVASRDTAGLDTGEPRDLARLLKLGLQYPGTSERIQVEEATVTAGLKLKIEGPTKVLHIPEDTFVSCDFQLDRRINDEGKQPPWIVSELKLHEYFAPPEPFVVLALDCQEILERAKQWRRKPKSLGGGAGSFTGMTLQKLAVAETTENTDPAGFHLTVIDADKVQIDVKGQEPGVQVRMTYDAATEKTEVFKE